MRVHLPTFQQHLPEEDPQAEPHAKSCSRKRMSSRVRVSLNITCSALCSCQLFIGDGSGEQAGCPLPTRDVHVSHSKIVSELLRRDASSSRKKPCCVFSGQIHMRTVGLRLKTNFGTTTVRHLSVLRNQHQDDHHTRSCDMFSQRWKCSSLHHWTDQGHGKRLPSISG